MAQIRQVVFWYFVEGQVQSVKLREHVRQQLQRIHVVVLHVEFFESHKVRELVHLNRVVGNVKEC